MFFNCFYLCANRFSLYAESNLCAKPTKRKHLNIGIFYYKMREKNNESLFSLF